MNHGRIAAADAAMSAAARAAAISRYLDYLRVERRVSPHTLSAYADDLARFDAHIDAQTPDVMWDGISGEQVRGFVASLHRAGRAPRTLQRRLSSVRSFLAWLAAEGDIRANVASGLRAPKAPRRLPQVPDADQMKALLEAPDDSRLAVRDRALFELVYSSGLRLAELCGLRWGELDIEGGFARVTGKGSKTRVVPVGSQALDALLAWRAQTPHRANEPVFAGRAGNPIAPRSVQARLSAWAIKHGDGRRLHPHLLRHACASHMLESSGNLRAVQELLGHADIGTTQIYTHLDFQHLSRVYDAAHPRARRKT